MWMDSESLEVGSAAERRNILFFRLTSAAMIFFLYKHKDTQMKGLLMVRSFNYYFWRFMVVVKHNTEMYQEVMHAGLRWVHDEVPQGEPKPL